MLTTDGKELTTRGNVLTTSGNELTKKKEELTTSGKELTKAAEKHRKEKSICNSIKSNNMKKLQSTFEGSEEDFTLVTGMICHSCLTNLDDFAAHKAKYTQAMIQSILNSSQKAALIPNQQQRQSTSTALRAVLVTANDVCGSNYLTLASYINSSFSADKINSMKKMAGGAYFTEARGCNWTSTTNMNSMMATFMDTYGNELTQGDMPADFPDTCDSDSTAFVDALDAYETNKQTALQQAQNRIAAFNRVHTSIKGIMDDGKLIYRNDASMRKQFTYSAVFDKVAKTRPSGFRIKVMDSVTKMPVAKANIQFAEGEWKFDADTKGVIIAKLPEGVYNGTVAAPGYGAVQVKFTASKGVMHREEVALVSVAQKVLVD